MKQKRRAFLKTSSLALASISTLGLSSCLNEKSVPNRQKAPESEQKIVNSADLFGISLAQWSLHKAHFANEMTALDFAKRSKQEFGVSAVEYVNAFFKDKAKDTAYLRDLKGRAASEGVESLLIMIDGEGNLGDLDTKLRKEAVVNHHKWVEAAKYLGCHSIRVNAYGEGDKEEVGKAATESLASLANFAKDFDINIIVENHGSYSSDGKWLAKVMSTVNLPNCGTLPDFGNFCIKNDGNPEWAKRICLEEYDRYKGVKEMMPFAKAVSAKTNDFDAQGNDTKTDYSKMMKIVLAAGYNGFVGIEYEGAILSEAEGIKATKKLLEKVREELAG